MIDIKEFEIPEDVLRILLWDHTTNKNIIWGTDQYGYDPKSCIEYEQIASGDVIKPRVLKSQEDQKSRTDSKAEVYTPIEIIKKMNDLVDEKFDGQPEDYIKRKVLEVTCGEAPYLVSRYDVSSGDILFLNQREGLLDRKMRLVNSLPLSHNEVTWEVYMSYALKSTYGYEWRGDSLLLARENILYDVIDWYEEKFLEAMDIDMIKTIADIISFNVVQMDGITMCVPYSDTPVRIMNWDKDQMERFDGKIDEISLF